jgi:hypothetical protein
MADRDILFQLRVASHPENQRQLAALADTFKQSTLAMAASVTTVGTRAAEASRVIQEQFRLPRSAEATLGQPARQPTLASAAGRGVGAVVVDRPLAPPQSSRLSEASRSQPLERRERDRPLVPESETAGARDRLAGLRDEVRGLAADAAGVRDSFDLNALMGDFQSLQQSIGGIDSETAKVEKSLGKVDRELAKAAKNGGQNFREMASRAEGFGEGLSKLTTGLALLGADSEKIKEFVETLKNVKGGVDVFTGLLKVVSNGSQTYSLLRERAEGAANAQTLLGDRTRLAAQATDLARQRNELLTTSGRQLVGTLRELATAEEASVNADRRKIQSARELANSLESVIAKTRQLDSAEDSLNSNQPRRRGAAGGTRGAVGGAVGGAVSGSAFEGVAQATGSTFFGQLAASLAGRFVEDRLDGLGGGDGAPRRRRGFGRTSFSQRASRIGGQLLQRGRGLATGAGGRLAVGGASVLSAAALAKLTFDTVSSGGSLDDSTLSGRIFGGIGSSRFLANADRQFQRFSLTGTETPYTRLADSFDATDRAQQRADAARAVREREDERKRRLAEERTAFDPLRDLQAANLRDQRSSLVDSGRLGGLSAAKLNSAAEARELQRAIESVADAEERISTDRASYVQSLERAQTVSQRLADAHRGEISSIKEIAGLRQSINRDSIAAAERRISLLDNESDRIRGIAQQAENQLLSGAQRFARLSDEDQRKTIQAQRVAQSGGRLSDEQRGLLDAIGTFSARDASRRADLQEARAKGFDRFFGGEERKLIDASDRSLAQQDRRELGAARSRLGSTIQDARRDGRVSLEESQGIRAAQSDLRDVATSQRLSRDARTSDRRSELGFSGQEAVRGANRLDRVGQQAQQLQVTVENRQQFQIQLKTNEDAAVAAVQRVLRDNQRGQEERMRKMLQTGLDGLREEQRRTQTANTQQGKNSRPS